MGRAQPFSGYRNAKSDEDRLTTLEADGGGVLNPNNWSMPAEDADADGELATAIPMAATPIGDGLVAVLVNGAVVTVGDGDKLAACYFSADEGATAKTIANVAVGDKLFWVPSVAGYPLLSSFLIGFLYIS